jgi:BirA family transcriptional regulator, biotin operon repressor / biotin---[acetyl-CoA-carboxylase] ligase
VEISQVEEALDGLQLGALRVYKITGSTNTEAASWVQAGAPDLALVVADEQTAGRGRTGRTWLTPPGAALAFSLVLRPPGSQTGSYSLTAWNAARYTALGALAVCQALQDEYDLDALIKWPNDVLLAGKKTAGVLAEAQWAGSHLSAVILGVGVNVTPASVPAAQQLNYPATCVESLLGRALPRLELLRRILLELLSLRERMWGAEFIQAWEQHLALRGQWVELRSENPSGVILRQNGRVLGLDEAGRLRLQDAGGEILTVSFGELHSLPRYSIMPAPGG